MPGDPEPSPQRWRLPARAIWPLRRLWPAGLRRRSPADLRRLSRRLPGLAGWLALIWLVVQVSMWVGRVISRGDSVTMKMALLGLAGVTGLMLLLVMVPNPRLGPYLIFGAMPMTSWLFKQSPGSGFNFLLDGLIVVSTISVVLNRKHTRTPQAFVVPLLFLTLIGFVEAANPNAGGTEMTAAYALRENVFPLFLFFVGLYAFRTVRQAERFSVFLMMIALFNGLWAVKQIFLGLDEGEEVWAGFDNAPAFWVDGQLRAFGTFDAPWAYAFYTNIALALGICLLVGSRSWVVRGLVLAALAANLAGMALAIVRTTWIMAALTLPFVVLLRLRHPLRPALALASLAGSLLVVTLMIAYALPTGRPNPVGFAQTLAELNIFDDDSTQDRFLHWSGTAIPALAEHPLGKGLGTTGGVAQSYNPSGYITTDNTYLTMGLEFGWPGLAIYVYLLLAALAAGLQWQAAATNRFVAWYQAGMVTVVILTLLSGFLNVYATGQDGTYVFFLLGLACFLSQRGREEEQPPPPRPAPQPAWRPSLPPPVRALG